MINWKGHLFICQRFDFIHASQLTEENNTHNEIKLTINPIALGSNKVVDKCQFSIARQDLLVFFKALNHVMGMSFLVHSIV